MLGFTHWKKHWLSVQAKVKVAEKTWLLKARNSRLKKKAVLDCSQWWKMYYHQKAALYSIAIHAKSELRPVSTVGRKNVVRWYINYVTASSWRRINFTIRKECELPMWSRHYTRNSTACIEFATTCPLTFCRWEWRTQQMACGSQICIEVCICVAVNAYQQYVGTFIQ